MTSLDVRAIDEAGLRSAARPRTKQELAVFLAEAAFDRAVERGGSDTTREIGGVLVGELLVDEAGPYLKIDTTIDALHAEEKGAELTFTHATWEHIHKEMDSRHQGKRVVGWYHTHPGFGVFLSDRDQFIHKSFFNLPFQVALVYDPKSKEHGLFGWRDDDVWRMRRYAIGAREYTWDGNRVAASPADAPPASAADDVRRPAADGGGDLGLGGSIMSLALTAAVLTLIAGFLGHWIGASSANAALIQAKVDVAKASSDGAQQAIGDLQHDLVGLLRDTLGDEAIHRPALQAVADLDAAIAGLEAAPAAAPGAARPAATELAPAISQLRAVRERFVGLTTDRTSAVAVLSAIERLTRQGGELRTELVHEVAEQRSGIGGLYAELAADAARAGDAPRAQRLLSTAAHLDPGNRPRYQGQLQSFDRDATLPRDPGDDARAPRERDARRGAAPTLAWPRLPSWPPATTSPTTQPRIDGRQP